MFAGYQYYPGGGWSDFVGSFDTKDEAEHCSPRDYDWTQIVDLHTGEVIP